jgi:hypothetical protein
MNTISAVNVLLRAADKAVQHGWVVVLCPQGTGIAKQLTLLLPTTFPEANVSGRTVLLAGGNRISVTDVGTKVFVPEGTRFAVALYGWSEDIVSDPKDLAAWKVRSIGVVPL